METFGPEPTVEDEPEPLDTYLLTIDTQEDRYVLLLETPDGNRLLPTWLHQDMPSHLTMATILHTDLWVAPTWLPPDAADVMVIAGSESQGWVTQVVVQANELPKFETDTRAGVWLPWAEFAREYGQRLGLMG